MRVMRRSKRRKKNPMRRESKGFGFYIVKTETTAAVVRGEWGRPLYILVVFGVLLKEVYKYRKKLVIT